MLHIAEYLPPRPSPLWKLAKQAGVSHAVGGLPFGEAFNGTDAAWDYMPLLRMQQTYESAGFSLDVIEARPPLNKAKRGLDGGEAEIDTVCMLLENMGRLGIPVWCYEWMTDFNWMRTATNTQSRGGSVVTSYDHSLIQHAPPTEHGPISEDKLWETLEHFLKRIVPVAEKANVKLAMHPDDPPLSPIRGVGRIMRSIDNFQRLLDLVPSPANGITMCQGNFTLMTDKLPDIIRNFGQQKKFSLSTSVMYVVCPKNLRKPGMMMAKPICWPVCVPTATSPLMECYVPTTCQPSKAIVTTMRAIPHLDAYMQLAISEVYSRLCTRKVVRPSDHQRI